MKDLFESNPELNTPGNTTSPGEFVDVKSVAACSSECSEAPKTNPILTVRSIPELIRTETDSSEYKTYRYPIEAQYANRVDELLGRSKKMRNPLTGLPLPTRPVSYGTTVELFTRIKRTVAEHSGLSDTCSALLTFWIFSTWCQEALSLAPCVLITGSSYDGDAILRTLKAFCYHPLLMAGMNSASLKAVNWFRNPTLLVSEPNLEKRMAALLGHSTSPGYPAILSDGESLDFFGPKAIYLGMDLPRKWTPPHCMHINATATSKVEPRHARHLSDEATEGFQNQLFMYRLMNLTKVCPLDSDASGLSREAYAIANALGSCIVDAPELQAQLVSLLTPHARQQIAERSDSLEALAINAALGLCHQGKDQMFVREIAAEVNRLQEARGEASKFSPEKVGHSLKKVGLLTRRLSHAGNGLIMDRATTEILHEVAAAYRGDDSAQEDGNLHCLLCARNKRVGEVM